MAQSLIVYEYDNYRAFLGDAVELIRKQDLKMTYRALAKRAGIKSSNFILLVIKGSRNLSKASIPNMTALLGLGKEEATYFKNLVLFNQAVSSDEKQLYAEQMFRSKGFRKAHPLAEAQLHYYSNWYYPAIREMVGWQDFKENADLLENAMAFGVSKNEISAAISDMVKLKLLMRGRDGKLRQTHNHITTDNEVASTFVARYHLEMIRMAGLSIHKFLRAERDISSVTLGYSESNLAVLKELIFKFRADIVNLASKQEKLDCVYQVNFQLFPLAFIKPRAK